MKRILPILLLMVSLSIAAADDVIVLKNSTRIDAKIEEINDTQIRYKKIGQENGPAYTVNITDVSIVILANGEVQSYANYQPPTSSSQKKYIEQGTEMGKQEKDRRTKLTFNPTPSDKRFFGLSFGYGVKQIKQYKGASTHYDWCGRAGSNHNYELGMVVHPEFKYGIGIKTGANFEFDHCRHGSRGSKYEVRALNLALNFPVQVSYRYEILKDLSVMFYTGPIFEVGYYLAIAEGGLSYSDWSGRTDPYFNGMWDIGGAVQWHGLRFSIGGAYSMAYSHNYTFEGYIHKPFYMTIGYMFNNPTPKKK